MIYIVIGIIIVLALPSLLDALGDVIAYIVGIALLGGGIYLIVKLIIWLFSSGSIWDVLWTIVKIALVLLILIIAAVMIYSYLTNRTYAKAFPKLTAFINDAYYTRHLLNVNAFKAELNANFPSALYEDAFKEKTGKGFTEYAIEQFRQLTFEERKKQYYEAKDAIRKVLSLKIERGEFVREDTLIDCIPNSYEYEKSFINFDMDFVKYCKKYYHNLVDRHILNTIRSVGAISPSEFVDVIVKGNPVSGYFDNWKKQEIEMYIEDVLNRRNDIEKVTLQNQNDDILFVNPEGGLNLIKTEIEL